MSHFNVAVILDGSRELGEVMEPYCECTENHEFLEFCDMEEELRSRYEEETMEMVRMHDSGELVSVCDDRFLEKISEEEYSLYREDSAYKVFCLSEDGQTFSFYRYNYGENEVVEVHYSEIYPSFDDFAEYVGGYTKDIDTGHHGYYYNPNSKWDWWSIGGRWAGFLKKKDGVTKDAEFGISSCAREGYCDSAKIRDIDFSVDEDAYRREIRFWEVYVDKQPLRENEHADDFEALYSAEYYKKRFKTKEQYAREMSRPSTFAVVTVDGVWHECGEMGWFGCSSETADEAIAWHNNWYDAFIKDANPDWELVVLDCHI